jgi:hypothetical protein
LEWVLLNWFEILKNTGLAQSQRQGFRLDDKDEDYILEDEEDCKTWYEGLLDMTTKFFEEMKQYRKYGMYVDITSMGVNWRNDIERRLRNRERPNPPDEMYCAFRELLQNADSNFVAGGQQSDIQFYPGYYAGLDASWEDAYSIEFGIYTRDSENSSRPISFGYVQNYAWDMLDYLKFKTFEEYIKMHREIHNKFLSFSEKINSYVGQNNLYPRLIKRSKDRLTPEYQERLKKRYDESHENRRKWERGE